MAAISRMTDYDQALAGVVEYSRLLGSDESLVLGGGGNTSVKAIGNDVAGRRIPVLLIKGSGSELRSVTGSDFAPLRLDDLLLLRDRDQLSDEDMVIYLERCKLDPAAPRPSIETLLHAFIPAAAVFHSHADAILSLINTTQTNALSDVFGSQVVAVPYQRPGFALSVEVAKAIEAAPAARAVVLLNHGLVTWGNTPAEAYQTHREIAERAAAHVQRKKTAQLFIADCALRFSAPEERRRFAARLAVRLRGALSREKHNVLVFDDGERALRFVGSSRARRASMKGALTPDHILTTKNLPLWLDFDGDSDDETLSHVVNISLADYAASYTEYVNRYRTDEPLLEAAPRIIAVPGVGLFAAGRDERRARLGLEIYRHTMQVMENAETLGGYRSLDEAEAFRAEYWPLELYKLTRAGAERDFAGRVALVTGAGSGLGRACASALAQAGAHVVVTDVDGASVRATADLLKGQRNLAGVLALDLDVTSEAGVAAAFEAALLAYGGIDVVVSNAGIAHSAGIEHLELEDWNRSLAVNATGHFLVTRAAMRLFRAQGTGGSIVFIASKNVVAPGAEFAAYSAAKAAEAQFARVAAIEGGAIGVRVNIVNPDAIFGGTRLWDEMGPQRAKAHGVTLDELKAFYRKRSLLGLEVRDQDVAEAVLFLAGERSSRTTGCMISVDAGVREAFPR